MGSFLKGIEMTVLKTKMKLELNTATDLMMYYHLCKFDIVACIMITFLHEVLIIFRHCLTSDIIFDTLFIITY